MHSSVLRDGAYRFLHSFPTRRSSDLLGFVNMGGEDFAAYLERMPGCFLRIGAREPGGEPIPAHSPRFYAAERSEEHTSELSHRCISYAVFFLKKKNLSVINSIPQLHV